MIELVEDKVAIEPIWDSDYSPSGLLIIPEEAKDRCDQGIIKYVGPWVKNHQVGDYVLFSGYTGSLVRLEGEGTLIIMREEWLELIVHPPATDIPGLFFQDADGQYWPATHEQATTLIARNYQDHKLIQSKNRGKPKVGVSKLHRVDL
jgi:co-chaperonin GroES (HSP10)